MTLYVVPNLELLHSKRAAVALPLTGFDGAELLGRLLCTGDCTIGDMQAAAAPTK